MLNRRVFFQAACRSKIKTMFFSMSLYLCGEMFFEFFCPLKLIYRHGCQVSKLKLK